MGFLNDISKGFNSLLGGITGATGVTAARSASKAQIQLQQQYLDMVKRIFDQSMLAVNEARAGGVFDPMKIRENVSRNVGDLVQGVAVRGLIEGAKEGDTVQSENIAKSAITGGKALADVDFEALQRELSSLGAVMASANGVGNATAGMSSAIDRGFANEQAATNAQGQRLGDLAFLSSQFFNQKPQGKPQFTGYYWE